jgi:predicted transcriptional regulator of viral defense system
MSVPAYLEEHHVFSLDEFRREVGEGRSPYNLLVRATEKGLADRVLRGVYVSRTGRFADVSPDPYLVVAALSNDVVMVYHSALELHGLAHSPSRRVQFTTQRGTESFTYAGLEFERYTPPKALSASDAVQSTTVVRREEGVVRVTTRERTLVDCVTRADRSGGLEEVARSLAGLPYVDGSNVLAYLSELDSPTAVARTGWLLEQRRSEWFVSEDALERMRSMLGRGPYYFTRKNEAGRWVPEWRLYLPDNAEELMQWVHE